MKIEDVIKAHDHVVMEFRKVSDERDALRNEIVRIVSEGFDSQDTVSGESASDYVLRKLKEERDHRRNQS